MDSAVDISSPTPGHSGMSALRKLLKMRETGLIAIILLLFVAMSFASPH